jgi:hypothetical protein
MMMKSNVLNKHITRNILLTIFVVVLAMAFVAALPKSAHADDIVVPPVPDGVGVKAEEGKVFLVGHAIGTQNYECQPSGAGVAFVLFTPQATLFSEDHGQIITHYFSPNPDLTDPNTDPKVVVANGAIRATWQYKDTSTIWAATVPGGASTDPNFVEEGAVAWVKLKVVGHQDGPTGGDKLSDSTFVQRLNTHGGLAPKTGCASLSDVGNKAFVPYRADYFFYK